MKGRKSEGGREGGGLKRRVSWIGIGGDLVMRRRGEEGER